MPATASPMSSRGGSIGAECFRSSASPSSFSASRSGSTRCSSSPARRSRRGSAPGSRSARGRRRHSARRSSIAAPSPIVWLALPVIGLLERAGLKERRASRSPASGSRRRGACSSSTSRSARSPRRSASTSLGGHAQMVRPLSRRWPKRRRRTEHGRAARRGRATTSARTPPRPTTSALFFGEDIFIAIGSILLIKSFLEQNGIAVEPARPRDVGDPDRDRRVR